MFFTHKIDQVYGSSVHGNRYNVGIHKTQLNYFRLNPRAIHTTRDGSRYLYWLRSVCDSTDFDFVSLYGHAGANYTVDYHGLRPMWVIG